ncbi:TWO-COMPONENT RESPONSE REGULATOR [Salix purpurea]|uniref:TWO-COMPONENT RESPONSE REGULATOR n=1 Tax=Salix purpurea TaxID=77065 RepID=A0A9Q0QER0_SALPP|nr:TWO-COMPONENT RESPONSE REGULATOR [Salix purpurea]
MCLVWGLVVKKKTRREAEESGNRGVKKSGAAQRVQAQSPATTSLCFSQGASFDLILMDMDMPARLTSGYEATTQLRSVYGVKSNIVGLTSSSESEEISELVGAGRLNGCIAKPLSDVKIDSLISKGKL